MLSEIKSEYLIIGISKLELKHTPENLIKNLDKL